MVMGDDSCSKGSHILDGHIFTLNCCKNCIVCLKRQKINGQEAGVGPFKKTKQITVIIPSAQEGDNGELFYVYLTSMHRWLCQACSGKEKYINNHRRSFVRSFCTCSISCKRIGALKGNLHETGLNFFASLNAEFLSCCSKQKQNSVQSIIAV